ncbi:hypothetical protein ACHAXA_005238 [Cyclostephanos tholiformis]|uniref:Exostosin GT47 domain-containing protein n=1 Tax=Cyclostephanos tholiformis TaxID=382380 RepID=A0ABD3SEZ3_9STRA
MVGIVLVATILVVAICQICQIFNSGYIGTEFRTAFAIGRREGGGPEPIIIDRRDLTFTDFGWFHPDPEIAISTGRFKSSAVYVDAVTSHPRYNSSAWAMLSRNPDPNRPILAFIDVETCGETCWPVMCSWETSVDLENNRSGPLGYLDDRACDFIERALTSPAMASSDSRLVVLSCFPETPMKCMASEGDGYRNRSIFNKLVVVHQTAHKTEGVARNDMGIPPLSVKPVVLNATERDDITNCRLGNGTRPYLFSFKGRPRFAEFEEYFGPLHGTQGIYATFGSDHYTNDETNVSYSPNRKQINSNDTYMNLLRSSHFSGSPRGDCLYSYRFSEVLSAGAIPVVYADGWILPYTSDVVDWNDVAVLLPQGEVNRTVDILKSFSAERICEMHKKVLEFYDEYVIDSHGRLRGILKVLEGRLRNEVNFSFAPGDSPP